MKLSDAQREFVTGWGALGASWGINRSMAMIHALLLAVDEPLSTDDVMEALQISRGNANTNLRELVTWNLIRVIVRPGDRKEYFEAEKEVWKMFAAISQERKRREIDPALNLLKDCLNQSKASGAKEEKEFRKTLKDLNQFVGTTSALMDKVGHLNQSKTFATLSKLVS